MIIPLRLIKTLQRRWIGINWSAPWVQYWVSLPGLKCWITRALHNDIERGWKLLTGRECKRMQKVVASRNESGLRGSESTASTCTKAQQLLSPPNRPTPLSLGAAKLKHHEDGLNTTQKHQHHINWNTFVVFLPWYTLAAHTFTPCMCVYFTRTINHQKCLPA